MAITEVATLAGGCFWCTEAVFKRLKGVETVTSGYTGGTVPNPSYDEVCDGKTGHAEATQLTFDPKVISYKQLLEVFFKLHDPTTPNRQGNDVGTQYRSAIFFHDARQKQIAEESKQKIKGAVTEILPATEFYPAEGYHQDYFAKNPDQGYCRLIIDPKIQKLYKDFGDLVK